MTVWFAAFQNHRFRLLLVDLYGSTPHRVFDITGTRRFFNKNGYFQAAMSGQFRILSSSLKKIV
jgi:hypothetical protein